MLWQGCAGKAGRSQAACSEGWSVLRNLSIAARPKIDNPESAADTARLHADGGHAHRPARRVDPGKPAGPQVRRPPGDQPDRTGPGQHPVVLPDLKPR